VYEAGSYMAHCTNNEAEYTGLLTGLRWAAGRTPPVASFTVHGDSQLVIKQMRGEFRVNAGNLLPLHAEAKALAGRIARVTYTHVYREHNAAADAAGNRACDERRDFVSTHAGPTTLPSALGKRGREEE
jgi:ribonuclease HI